MLSSIRELGRRWPSGQAYPYLDIDYSLLDIDYLPFLLEVVCGFKFT